MVAVLAHEIGHYKKKHVLQGVVISILHTGAVLFLLSLFLGSPGLYQASIESTFLYAGFFSSTAVHSDTDGFIDSVADYLPKNEYGRRRLPPGPLATRTAWRGH